MKTGTLKILWLAVFLSSVVRIVSAVDATNELREAFSDYQRQDYESALEHFNQVLSFDTHNIAALVGRGGCYSQLKQFQNAERDYNTAVATDTNNVSLCAALINRGYFYACITNLDKAMDDYSKAIQYNPANALAYTARARIEIAINSYADAMQDCNMAIMLNPDSAESHDVRAGIFMRTQQYDRSIADYTKAISLDTNNPFYYSSRGLAYSQKDDNLLAVNDFSYVLKLIGDNRSLAADIYGCRGLCLSRLGQFNKGIQDCKRGVQINTNSMAALNNLAWLLATAPDAKLRNGQLAVGYASRACELSDWKNAYDIGTLAAAYAETGDFDKAVKWQKKAILIGFPLKENEQAHRELDLFEEKRPYHAKK